MTDYVSQDRMAELIDSGEATPMLRGMEVGPTFHADRWWYIPAEAADDADYQLADPELSERFDRLRRRAEAVDRVQAELDEGRAERGDGE
ncbi:hypothetical protein [Kribbella sp. NPDC048928]|uniref:hypothetical protein n=1 Tax=Kribbella sp. NPDC048928 TaxID=3364111 RepID=UPI0037165ABE